MSIEKAAGSIEDEETEHFVDCLISDNVCHKCEEIVDKSSDVDIVSCECFRKFHRKCVSTSGKKFKCEFCKLGRKWCFGCKKNIEEGVDYETCALNNCRNSFHASCISNLNEKSNRRFVCSHHYCSTCAIDGKPCTEGPFLSCIRCPTAYHKQDRCVPAGTFLLNSSWVVCSEHSDKSAGGRKTKINVNFCFACGLGGVLICCENCPSAFHLDCAGLKTAPDECFFCPDCLKNKKPLYGDIVWAKFGSHRWWPAQVINPLKVPTNLEKYLNEPGVFIVQFYGTHDYGPVTRRSVYPFVTDDDKEAQPNRRTDKDRRFSSAITEARQALQDRNFAQLSDAPIYIPIRANKYHRCVSPAYANDQSQYVCTCNVNQANPCGDEFCENRSTFCECNSKFCLAEEKCANQRFTRRLYSATVKFLTIDRGFGLRLLLPVKKGDFIIEYCGEVITQEECNRRLHEKNEFDFERAFYFLELAHDKIIDAGPMGNDARFINHSCDANCITQRWVVNGEYRIGLFASRDIDAGEELTFHYNLDTLGFNFETPCKCAASNCSGFIGKKYKKNKSNSQDQQQSKRRKCSSNVAAAFTQYDESPPTPIVDDDAAAAADTDTKPVLIQN